MNDDGGLISGLIGVLIVYFCVLIIFAIGYGCGIRETKHKAVIHHAANYIADKDGSAAFKWNDEIEKGKTQ